MLMGGGMQGTSLTFNTIMNHSMRVESSNILQSHVDNISELKNKLQGVDKEGNHY
jgi:hypothetical protein